MHPLTTEAQHHYFYRATDASLVSESKDRLQILVKNRAANAQAAGDFRKVRKGGRALGATRKRHNDVISRSRRYQLVRSSQ